MAHAHYGRRHDDPFIMTQPFSFDTPIVPVLLRQG